MRGPSIGSAYRVPGREATDDEAALWSLAPLSDDELNAASYAQAAPSEPVQPLRWTTAAIIPPLLALAYGVCRLAIYLAH